MAALGRYELQEVLGQGGFATVYRAHDPVLDRDLAIKILHPHLASDPQIADRFVREGRALARLRHPNLVQVHDAGLADGQTYLAMELVPGKTLAEVSAGRKMALAEVGPIVEQVAGALDAVHAAGLVHRDIKPPNIIVADDGRAVLLDLGIARDMEQTGVTATGLLVGTPGFLAPEQVDSSVFVGPWTDVYQLGATVYTLLAGKPPFEGNTAQVLYSVAHRPPPDLGATRSDLPVYAIAAVTRALAKDPNDRPATAGEFAEALGGGSAAASGAPPRPTGAAGPEPPMAMANPAAAAEVTQVSAGQPTIPYLPPRIPSGPRPAEGAVAGKAPTPRPVSRKGLWGALAVVAIVLIGAVAVLAFRGGSSDEGEADRTGSDGTAMALPDGIVPGGAVVDVYLSEDTPEKLDFTAPASKRISLALKQGEVGATISIVDEEEQRVGSKTFIGKNGGFVDTREMAKPGRYWLVMEPEAGGSGSIHVQMFSVPEDASADISAGGAPVTLEVTVPGQNARAEFKASAGQRFSLRVTASTAGMTFSAISTEPGSSSIARIFFSVPGGFLDTFMTREAGTYAIVADPGDKDTGKATLTLYDVGPDVALTATPGTSLTVVTTKPGQNAVVTFAGRAAERIAVRATKVASGSTLILLDEDEKEFMRGFASPSSGAFIEPTRLLPIDGDYQLTVNPDGLATENLTLTIYDIPADAAAELRIGGPPASVAITVPGQNGRMAISGTKGQVISLKLTTLTEGTYVAIANAAGETGSTRRYVSAGSTYDRIPVLSDGDLTILIDPEQATIGTFTLTATLATP
jgi:serine/threonine-protein kinase